MSPKEYEEYLDKQVVVIANTLQETVKQGIQTHEKVCNSSTPEICNAYFANELAKLMYQRVLAHLEENLNDMRAMQKRR